MPEFATAELLHRSLKRFDLETEAGLFQTPRYRLKYVSWGSGPKTIVFVHGLSDLPRSFAMVMAPVVDAGNRVVSYHLAHGLFDGAVLGKYHHEDFVLDLIELLDHLQLEQAYLFGSSFGSTVTLRALAEHPDRFPKAVLQGGFARRPLIRIERGLSRLGRYWAGRMCQLPIRKQVMTELERPMFAGAPDVVFQFLLFNSGQTPIRAAARRALILDKLDLRPLLPSIQQPVLMIGGDRDTIITREREAEVEAGLPNVRRIEYAPCGHYPQYTLPLPTAHETIQFLDQ